MKMPLGMEVGLGPGDFVLDGDPAPPPQKGAESPNFFRPIFTARAMLALRAMIALQALY